MSERDYWRATSGRSAFSATYPATKAMLIGLPAIHLLLAMIGATDPRAAEAISGFQTRDMFIAFAEGGDFSIAAPGQAAKVQHYESGQAIFLPGGQARSFASAGGTIHAMLVEVK